MYRIDLFIAKTDENTTHIHNLKGYLLDRFGGFSIVETDGFYQSNAKTYIEKSLNFIIMTTNFPDMLDIDIKELFNYSGEESVLMTISKLDTMLFIELKK